MSSGDWLKMKLEQDRMMGVTVLWYPAMIMGSDAAKDVTGELLA